MKKINDENLEGKNIELEEGLEKPNFFTTLGKTLFVPALFAIGFMVYSCSSDYSAHKKWKEENQWMSSGVDNCVVDSNSKTEEMKIYKIVLQDNIFSNEKRALYYDSNGKQYVADIDIDILDGLTYIATLDNKNKVFISFNHDNRTCHIFSFTDDSQTLFSKDGYFSYSSDFNSTGDWEFAKMLNDVNKKQHKKK